MLLRGVGECISYPCKDGVRETNAVIPGASKKLAPFSMAFLMRNIIVYEVSDLIFKMPVV